MNLISPRRVVLLFAIVMVAVFALALISRHVMDRATVLRSYAVAPEITQEMSNAIGLALAGMNGRVSVAADGHLLVTAPRSVQDDVEAIVREVAASKPGPTPTINFEVWLVSAAPAAAAKAENGPGLAEISQALDGIQKAQGPEALHFSLLEKLALRVRAGETNGRIQGLRAGAYISPTVRNDAKGDPVIAARMEVGPLAGSTTPNAPVPGAGHLEAVVELRPGQLLVLGQSSQAGKNLLEQIPVYYLVRASL
jgi:hypothetical protein